MMKYRENCAITEIKREGDYLTLTIAAGKIARETNPGQFVNVRADDSFEPLLRRPFSVSDVEGDSLTLMILMKGAGTRKISLKKAGDTLNVIGPLGNGFTLTEKRKPLFVAGGIGIAPFRYFSRKAPGSVLLFGAKNSRMVPDLTEFRKRCDVKIATEDGSAGVKGTVIDLLSELDLKQFAVYACGPNPMFRAMNKVLSKCPAGTIEAYYSIETVMGCGFGACKGCAVETPSGDLKLACTDGPVFPWNGVKL